MKLCFAGVRETAKAELTSKLRRTQIINHIQKKSSLVGNALGSIAVSYCAAHCLLGWTESKFSSPHQARPGLTKYFIFPQLWRRKKRPSQL